MLAHVLALEHRDQFRPCRRLRLHVLQRVDRDVDAALAQQPFKFRRVGGLVAEIDRQGLKKAVLVGAGFIGLEVDEALINRGLDVTMVEMANQIMPGILDEDIARFAQIHMEDNDVELVLGETVTALEGGDQVNTVVTNKQKIAADFVVIGVGTRPNDDLARAAGGSTEEQQF